MRAIILAAGEGFLLDGMVKCLVRAPHDGRPLLERMIDGFARHQITVVVGYRAVDVMQQYPDLDYVYNADWATTNNSYSLGLALMSPATCSRATWSSNPNWSTSWTPRPPTWF